MKRNSQVGPGSYNELDSFRKLRQKSCSSKMMLTTYGKEAGNPHYVYIGDQLMLDPSFFDNRTKSVLKKNDYGPNQKLYQKELFLKQLIKLQETKSGSRFRQNDKEQDQLNSSRLNNITPRQKSQITNKCYNLNKSSFSKKELGINQKVHLQLSSTKPSIDSRPISQQRSRHKSYLQSPNIQDKKKEIISIMSTTDASLNQNQTSKDKTLYGESSNNSRMNQTFIDNSHQNSERKSQDSIIVMNGTQQQRFQIKKQNDSKYDEGRMTMGSMSTEISNKNSIPKIFDPSKLTMQQTERKYNTYSQNFNSQQIQKLAFEGFVQPKRMREFDKSFQILKLYGNPYQRIQNTQVLDKFSKYQSTDSKFWQAKESSFR